MPKGLYHEIDLTELAPVRPDQVLLQDIKVIEAMEALDRAAIARSIFRANRQHPLMATPLLSEDAEAPVPPTALSNFRLRRIIRGAPDEYRTPMLWASLPPKSPIIPALQAAAKLCKVGGFMVDAVEAAPRKEKPRNPTIMVEVEAAFDLSIRRVLGGEGWEQGQLRRFLCLAKASASDPALAARRTKGLMNRMASVIAALGRNRKAIIELAQSTTEAGRTCVSYETVSNKLHAHVILPVALGTRGGTNPSLQAMMHASTETALAETVAAAAVAQDFALLFHLSSEAGFTAVRRA